MGDDPAVHAFLDDAASHGVGRNGLSIPVRNRRGMYARSPFPEISRERSGLGTKAITSASFGCCRSSLISAANINSKLPSPSVCLSRREEQCLIWAARGKTYQEIGEILELTFGSVKTHLDAARHKLHCLNLAHAVGVAVATGVIPAKALQ